jgi:protein phosphatase
MATEAIVDFFRATATEDFTWPFHFDARMTEEENRLLTGIRLANRQIIDKSTRSREFHGMGTTVVGALFSGRKKKMFIGHVGDSRAYRVRQGEIRQMTRDHSLVNDYLLAMPELTEEQKNELPKNVITRALGMQEHVAVDIQSDDTAPGDVYILCSDGLSGMIEDQDIRRIVMENEDLDEACRKLVALANEHGGEDNVTALVVRVEAEPGDEPGISLSDTLPTPLSGKLPKAPDATADTPPAPNAAPTPPGTPNGSNGNDPPA